MEAFSSMFMTSLADEPSLKSPPSIGTDAIRKREFYIPPELIRGIADNLLEDHSVLYSLSLTNKLWNQECQPLLYHTVIHGPVADDEANGAPLSVFLANPHLTRYIHTYRLQQDSDSIESPPDDWWYLLRPGPALRAMINLKELHVEIPFEVDQDTVPDDILGDSPFQLLSFTWGASPTYPSRGVVRFLATQQNLRRLRCIIRLDEFDIPLELPGCAKLQHIEGGRGSMETLLPGRNVSSLVWLCGKNDPATSVQHLSRELGSLEKLSLYGYFSLPFFDELIRNSQNVQYLELITTTVSLQSIMLPRLRGLILRSNIAFIGWELHRYDEIFAQCPLLEFLDIEDGSMLLYDDEEINPRTFVRYTRGGDEMEYERPRRQLTFNSFGKT